MKKINKRTTIIALVLAAAIIVSAVAILLTLSRNKPVDIYNPKFGDAVDIDGYRYVYLGCNDAKEFRNGFYECCSYYALYRGPIITSQRKAFKCFSEIMSDANPIYDLDAPLALLRVFLLLPFDLPYQNFKDSFFSSLDGWFVYALDTTQTEYPAIMERIGNTPVVSMNRAFEGCTALVTAPVVPNTVVEMYGAFNGCTSLVSAPVLPDSVTDITGIFHGCAALKTYNESVNCEGDFSNYIIPNSVKSMPRAFEGCESMTVAPALPDDITDMTQMFLGCVSLTSAPQIPNSVTTMNYAFYECFSLENAPIIPDNVIEMQYAFGKCIALEGEIEINGEPTKMMGCFADTLKPITIVGACSDNVKQKLKSTASCGNVSY